LKPRPTLFRRAALSIGVGLLVFQLLSMLAVAAYVLIPLEKKSAEDFAALVLLSARTWVELPPETRDAFAVELATNHQLELREVAAPATGETRHHPTYVQQLRTALARQADPGVVSRLSETSDGWFHIDIAMAGHPLRFSFSYDRLESRPFQALVPILGLGVLVSVAVAWFLARRVSRPVAYLAQAARQIGSGERPAALPEDVEQELADLAHVFNQTSAKLAAQRENQDTLLAGVSHDLRSPLTRLQMAVGMLAEEHASPLLARMEADIAAMDSLIGAQLQLARVRQREAVVATDIDALLRDVVAAGAASGSAAIRLRTTARGCTSAIAPVALRRIVANLIDNACLHGGKRELEVVRRRCGNSIVIGVRDRGPGIPPEMREAVFRPFVRVEPSRSRATGGAGLGLAIARQLADTHGWTLALKSRVGGGASFWLAVPVQDVR
jgi:two-component system osmolarity sensor histidine kinase EnvZ